MWYKNIKIADLNARARFLYNKYKDKYEQNEFLQNTINFSEDFIKKLAEELDPSAPKYKYTEWILKQVFYGRANFQLQEDYEDMKESLRLFHKLKNKPSFPFPKDINQYKNLGDLSQAVHKDLGLSFDTNLVRKNLKSGFKTIYKNNDGWEIVALISEEAVNKLCQETKWCVRFPDQLEYYIEEYGPPDFLLILKDGERMALMHQRSDQLRDIYDRDISLFDNNPLMKNKEELNDYEKKLSEIYEVLDDAGLFAYLTELKTNEILSQFDEKYLKLNNYYTNHIKSNYFEYLKETIERQKVEYREDDGLPLERKQYGTEYREPESIIYNADIVNLNVIDGLDNKEEIYKYLYEYFYNALKKYINRIYEKMNDQSDISNHISMISNMLKQPIVQKVISNSKNDFSIIKNIILSPLYECIKESNSSEYNPTEEKLRMLPNYYASEYSFRSKTYNSCLAEKISNIKTNIPDYIDSLYGIKNDIIKLVFNNEYSEYIVNDIYKYIFRKHDSRYSVYYQYIFDLSKITSIYPNFEENLSKEVIKFVDNSYRETPMKMPISLISLFQKLLDYELNEKFLDMTPYVNNKLCEYFYNILDTMLNKVNKTYFESKQFEYDIITLDTMNIQRKADWSRSCCISLKKLIKDRYREYLQSNQQQINQQNSNEQ